MAKPVEIEINKAKFVFKNQTFFGPARQQQNEFRKTGKFCDWVLKTEDGCKFPVHKLVLASTNLFFQGLLNSDMIETRQAETVLPDITEENLEIVLNYIYTGEIEITTQNMQDIFRHASFYRLVELETAATKFIRKNITVNNCLELWQFGEQLMNEEVAKNSLAFILKNASKLYETAEIQDLTFEKVNKLMESNNSEELMYKLMENWMSKDFAVRETNFKSLLDQIDFSQIDEYFLTTVIIKNEQFKQNRDFLLKLVDLHDVKFKNKKKLKDEFNADESFLNFCLN